MTKILKEKNGNITLKVYQDVTEVQEDQKTTAIPQERLRVRDLTSQDIDRIMRLQTKI
jgi:hypothetical protein